MAEGDNDTMIKLLVAGGAAFAGWKFLYQPWAIQQRLNAEIAAQTAANIKKGMSLSDASTAAVSGACQAVAAFYKIPPDKSGGVCHGIGALATYTTALTIKAGIKAGKAIGHGAAVVGRGIGRGVATGAKDTAKVAKFLSYTAPKKVVTTAASAVKFASYTAPKKVTVAAVKGVGKGAKAVAKSISHGFGLWGLGDVDGGPGGPRRALRSSAALSAGRARRQAVPNLATGRARRSLAGLSEGTGAQRQRHQAGTAFYDRHLR
ncbi:MAG TPA: hypothetical protein VNH17_02340 [Streptosporangiaceae bacterium]|nr:hypothetical protein [Streptosporangiaceae bacterium]